MMKINLSHIKNDVGAKTTFQFTASAGEFGFEDDHPFAGGSVLVEGEAANAGTMFTVQGVIRATANHVCDRCLKEYSEPVVVAFSEQFREASAGASSPETETDTAVFQGDEIDLASVVRDAVVLAGPLKTLCDPMCRGLCPQCGANLNESSCACPADAVDPRLAALGRLLRD